MVQKGLPVLNNGLVGHMVPFLIGMPSVKAMVIDISTHDQYVLVQRYTTQNEKGEWFDVKKTYYRDRYFIDAYWADCSGCTSYGDELS